MASTAFLPLLAFPKLHRRRPQKSETKRILPRSQRVPPAKPLSEQALSTFSIQVSGEWKGYEGTFTPSGSVQPVPDYYIPEEFMEWGLTPHGFESVHSVKLRGQKLYRKFFRILPAVSLFADHVDTEEEFGYVDLTDAGVSVFDDSSWIRGAVKVGERVSKLEKWPRVEVCLLHPAGERRRVNVVLSFDWAERRVVDEVRVVLEEWVCEYCDGADMDSGSGYVEGWVSGETRIALDGVWKEDDGTVVERNGGVGVGLPEGIDFGIDEMTNEDGVVVWVGWCVSDTRVVVRRTFDAEGAVSYSERVLETRVG